MKKSNNQIKIQLLKEFRNIKKEYPKNGVNAVVVLSAEEVDIKGENRKRILAGTHLMKKCKSSQLIFLGTIQHNSYLKNFIEKKLPNFKISYPVNRQNATTRTQIIDLAKFLNKNKLESILLVSHAYHIPRIKRYCLKYLPKDVKLYFWPVGNIKTQTKQTDLEIEKIIKYQTKGHL